MKKSLLLIMLAFTVLAGCQSKNSKQLDFYMIKQDSMEKVTKGILVSPKNFTKIQSELDKWKRYNDSSWKYFYLTFNK